ncbi:hypothetical protein [Amycolatopsis tolypomycina]|uniref:hypothetical protein n=1 Tax=Amycolatopsis tolypomycina TaxID=208445 RepID=UPI0033BF1022
MLLPFGRPITVHRDNPAGVDPKTGDPRPGVVEPITVDGCAVVAVAEMSATGSAETSAPGRTVASTRRILYAPYGTDIRKEDRVEYEGVLYQVDGVPIQERSPLSGTEGYMKVALEVVDGPLT